MKCSWHGHSVVQIETINNYKIIIDPFITGNDACDLEVDQVDVDFIVLTHGHSDHVGDALAIAKNTKAPIVAMVELADFMESQGANTHPMNIGGTAYFPFGSIKMTLAHHSSSYDFEGETIPMGLAAGVIIDDGASKLYHAGDTALFMDMQLISPVDIAFLPIGDNYTMGIKDAVKAVNLIQPKKVVPIHYNTFPIIEQNPYEFINRLDDGNGLVPKIGEIIEC